MSFGRGYFSINGSSEINQEVRMNLSAGERSLQLCAPLSDLSILELKLFAVKKVATGRLSEKL